MFIFNINLIINLAFRKVLSKLDGYKLFRIVLKMKYPVYIGLYIYCKRQCKFCCITKMLIQPLKACEIRWNTNEISLVATIKFLRLRTFYVKNALKKHILGNPQKLFNNIKDFTAFALVTFVIENNLHLSYSLSKCTLILTLKYFSTHKFSLSFQSR